MVLRHWQLGSEDSVEALVVEVVCKLAEEVPDDGELYDFAGVLGQALHSQAGEPGSWNSVRNFVHESSIQVGFDLSNDLEDEIASAIVRKFGSE